MKLTFLGTGTSQGVPLILSDNETLDLSNPKNWRCRSSVHIEIGSKHIQVDASPEFRLQAMKNNIRQIDFFILTHGHADHILGMDDLRRFCDLKENHIIDVYGEKEGLKRVSDIYPYALGNAPTNRGYPCFKLHNMPEILELGNGNHIYSTLLPHGSTQSLGLVFEEDNKRIAYYCDAKKLTDKAKELAEGIDVLVIDGLRPQEHHSHMSIYEAIEYGKELKVKKLYITHTTHLIDYDTWQKKLPPNFNIAYDNLEIII